MKTITLKSLIPIKYRSVPVWAILVLGAMVVMLVLAFVWGNRMRFKTIPSDDMAVLVPCTDVGKKPASFSGGDTNQQRGQTESASKDTHELRSNPLRLPRQDYARAKKWINSSADRKKRFGPYLPQMTLRDRAKLMDTWRAFHDACAIHNISYFLVEGTLLGAIRHRGFIPWDSDMDVAVDVRDSVRVQHVLSCLPGYTLRVQSNMHWKFFAVDASVVPVVPPATTLHAKTLSDSQKGSYAVEFEPSQNVVMRYPFVDVFFVTQDDKYTWALTEYMVNTIAYLTEDIYPLTVAHFEGYLAPVPRHSHNVLHTTFDANVCLSPSHNYREGHGIDGINSVPCQDLAEIYPIYEV